MNPYAVLKIARGASQEEIKQAYRLRAKETHPDTNPNDPHAKEKFQSVQAAYEMLVSPQPVEPPSPPAQPAYGFRVVFVNTYFYVNGGYVSTSSSSSTTTNW